MTNEEILHSFGDNDTKIEELLWLPFTDPDKIKEFTDNLTDEEWQKMFPLIYDNRAFKAIIEDNNIFPAMYDAGYLVFLAELSIPKCKNINIKDGKATSWSNVPGMSYVSRVYAETREDLAEQIRASIKKWFDYDIQKQGETA